MSRLLVVRNLQKIFPLNIRSLRRVCLFQLQDLLRCQDYELGIYVVDGPRITSLNETFLRHRGSTDVITFDYAEPRKRARSFATRSHSQKTGRERAGTSLRLQGEVFVCIEESISQARRFRSSWQSELVRYIGHGFLHLCGYDDSSSAERRTMKKEEDWLTRETESRFELGRILTGHRR